MTNASTVKGREQIDTAALLGAAGAGDAARVASLLAAGADVNAAAAESGETALIRAASKGHAEVVRVLLAAGADTRAEREDGFTALGAAVFFGYADVVRALLAAGADPAAKGRLGANAEKWALFSGFTEIAEMLRDPARAREPNAAAGESGARVYFPDKGTFSAVVPLSKLDEPSPDDTAAAGESAQQPDVESGGDDALRQESLHQESGEVEAETLVRPRKNVAVSSPVTPVTPAPPVTPAARAENPRRSWPVMAIVLALSLTAGATTGALLLKSRRSAERQPTPPPAESSAPAADVATQAPQPPPAEPTPDAAPSPSPPAAQPPEMARTTETEPRAANVGSDSNAKKTNKDEPTDASKRGREADAAARRDATPDARASRPARARVEKDVAARRETPAPRRTRAGERRAPSASSRNDTSPVFSPPPASKAERSKVIPWP